MNKDQLPTIDRLSSATDTLQWLGARFNELPEERTEAVVIALQLSMASMILMEYAKHLADGKDPYDALLSTARGELKLTQSQTDLLRAVVPPRLMKQGPDAAR